MREITLTEARRRLSSLVREIRQDPDAGYRIRVRDRIVAELRSPRPTETPNAAEALLRLADKIARRRRPKKPRLSSQNYKDMLYGKNGVLRPRSGR